MYRPPVRSSPFWNISLFVVGLLILGGTMGYICTRKYPAVRQPSMSDPLEDLKESLPAFVKACGAVETRGELDKLFWKIVPKYMACVKDVSNEAECEKLSDQFGKAHKSAEEELKK
eukprot:207255_1